LYSYALVNSSVAEHPLQNLAMGKFNRPISRIRPGAARGSQVIFPRINE
jgi:hypothetical protein